MPPNSLFKYRLLCVYLLISLLANYANCQTYYDSFTGLIAPKNR